MIPVPFDPADVRAADAVLATHEHLGHVHGPPQAPVLARTGATFYGPRESVALARDEEDWPGTYAVDAAQHQSITAGGSPEIGEFTVHIKPANDRDAEQPVTYVVEHRAGTFFHGGDHRPAAAFPDVGERYDIDPGCLAFGTQGIMPHRETGKPTLTRWYNNERELIEAANRLQLDRLLPSHWDMWKRLTADPPSLYPPYQELRLPEAAGSPRNRRPSDAVSRSPSDSYVRVSTVGACSAVTYTDSVSAPTA